MVDEIVRAGSRSTPARYVHEQDGLRDLASYLPDAEPFHVWANVEFVGAGRTINEVDALVLTPSGWSCWSSSAGGVRSPRTAPSRCAEADSRLAFGGRPYVPGQPEGEATGRPDPFYARRPGREPRRLMSDAAVFLHARGTSGPGWTRSAASTSTACTSATPGCPVSRSCLLTAPRSTRRTGSRHGAGRTDRRAGYGREDPAVGGDGPQGGQLMLAPGTVRGGPRLGWTSWPGTCSTPDWSVGSGSIDQPGRRGGCRRSARRPRSESSATAGASAIRHAQPVDLGEHPFGHRRSSSTTPDSRLTVAGPP